MSIQMASFYRYAAAILVAVFFVLGWGYLNGIQLGLARFSYELLFLAVVVYPVCEEIIFRGTIQAELQKRLKITRKGFFHISLANLVTSLLFALIHALYFQTPLAAIVFFPSLVFGYMYEKEKHLFAPIFIHGTYNLIGLFGIPTF